MTTGTPTDDALFTLLVGEDDRVLAWLELEQDTVWASLTMSQRLRYIDHALGAGRAAAYALRGQDPSAIAAAEQVAIRVVHGDNRVAGVPTRSEYDAESRAITLYQTSLDEVLGLLERAPGAPWAGEHVAALHIAHELFHHLEATRFPPLDEQLPAVAVRVRLGGIWGSRRRSPRCREVGAHAFAKTLLGLPFFPSVLDWLGPSAVGGRQTRDRIMLLLERAREGISEAVAETG